MSTIRLNPSPELRRLVAEAGGVSAAATAWRVQYRTLKRFLDGTGSLHGESIAAIITATRRSYNRLFIHLQSEQPAPEPVKEVAA